MTKGIEIRWTGRTAKPTRSSISTGLIPPWVSRGKGLGSPVKPPPSRTGVGTGGTSAVSWDPEAAYGFSACGLAPW